MADLIKHCPWSPSYLLQIMRCLMSLAKDGLAIDDTNEAAEHGTLQHAFLINDRLAKHFGLESIDADITELSQDEIYEVEVAYQRVLAIYQYLKKKYARIEVVLEKKVILDAYLPNPCWGYVDIAFIGHRAKPNKDGIYDKSMIYVIDAKFGRLPVSAFCEEFPNEDGYSINPQLCSYWCGLFDEYKDQYQITRGGVAIIQPKINNYPSFLDSHANVHFTRYMREVIAPKVYEAVEGNPSYSPSTSHCLHCKNKIHCKHNIAQLIAFNELLDKPEMLDDSVIEDLVLPFANNLKKLCDSVLNYCLKRAEEGKKWKGFALSTGRPTRVYTDESEARRIALEHGYKDFVVESILSPAQAEKLLGKNNFKDLLGNLVTYKAGKNTLVPEAEAKGTTKDFIKQENK